MKLPASLARSALVCVSAVLFAASAQARNEQFLLLYADAMKTSRVHEIVGGVPLRFGGESAAKADLVRADVVVTGEGSTAGNDPRQHHVERYTDEQICLFALEDALVKLMVVARENNAGAVVGIVSDYRGNVIDDAHTYECRAGSVRSYVSLRAQISRSIPANRPAPPASGFAPLEDANAVPLSEAGKDRYRYFLTLPKPRAFVVFEDGHWHFNWKDPEAMTKALNYCARLGKRCWLYAVDDQVVWDADVARRIGSSAQLSGGAKPATAGDGE